MSREYGIEGFCYWHYWFGGGERLLERSFNEVLKSGDPDYPFCLAWANESGTGIWHGAAGMPAEKPWNEWAEGNHLEPDTRYGRGYLEVIKMEPQGHSSS